MSNRRLMIRRRRRLPVTLGGRLAAVTAEVSETGFSAEMMQVFLPGSKVHGTINCGDRDLAFRGVVSWAEPGHPHLSIASRFGVRFTAQVWPGDTLTFSATITAKHDDGPEPLVDLECVARNQDGVEVMTGSATAAVAA